MDGSARKTKTLDDLRQEVADWRKHKPRSRDISIFVKNPGEVAAGMIFFIILVSTVLCVPLIELFKLLILRPLLALFHSMMVIVAAIFLRLSARPFIRREIKTIKNNRQKGEPGICKDSSGWLRFFVRCFGPSLKYYLKIDTRDARSIGKFQEWIQDTLGVEAVWIESDVNRAVRQVTWCPFAGREIPYFLDGSSLEGTSAHSDGCMKYCSRFIADWANEFLTYCNPDFEMAPIEHLTPEGHAFCEFVWKRKTPFGKELRR
jgi:hypothetical protein